jgi:hypothetical protein
VRQRAAALGEYTDQILAELGFDAGACKRPALNEGDLNWEPVLLFRTTGEPRE